MAKPCKVLPTNPKKILFVLIAGMGDAVLSVPTLRSIRHRYPNAEITILNLPRTREVLEGLPYFDHLAFIPRISPASITEWQLTLKQLLHLRRQRFDLIVNLEGVPVRKGAQKMAFLFWLLNGNCTVGRNTNRNGFFYDIKIPDNESEHEVDITLRIAQSLGGAIDDTSLEIYTSPEDVSAAKAFCIKHGINLSGKVIVFNPGAFRPTRRWPEEYWAALGNRLIDAFNASIILTGSPAESELLTTIKSLIKRPTVLNNGLLSIKQLSALLKTTSLLVTNDTGTMHIGSACNIPMVALFGPGDPIKYAPRNNKAVMIFSTLPHDISCTRPCYKHTCDNLVCMQAITVDEVYAIAKNTLSSDGASHA